MRTTLRCTTLLTMIQQLYCVVTLIAFASPLPSRFGASWGSKLERTKVVVVVVVMVRMRAPLFLWVERQAPEKSPSQLCSQEETKRGRFLYRASSNHFRSQFFCGNKRQEFRRSNTSNCLLSFDTIFTKLKTTRPTDLLYCRCIRCRGNVLTCCLAMIRDTITDDWLIGEIYTPLNVYIKFQRD
jgi:hypothetical protein